MTLHRILQHLIILGYISVTLSGVLFTFARVSLPFIPGPITFFSYGMMAPYQSTPHEAQDLTVEGLNSTGEWEVIDLRPYVPFLRAQRIVRMTMVGFSLQDEGILEQRYKELARQVKRLEAARGREYSAMRLYWDTWPLSVVDYYQYNQELFRTRHFLTDI